MEKKINEGSKIAMFGHKRWSREGGVEIVVKELCTRMVQNVHALNRKCASTLQSLRYFVPTISERRVFPKYCIKRENQCRSRAAAEIQSDEAVEG